MEINNNTKITLNGIELDISNIDSDFSIDIECGQKVKYNKYNLELTTIPNSDADKYMKRLVNKNVR